MQEQHENPDQPSKYESMVEETRRLREEYNEILRARAADLNAISEKDPYFFARFVCSQTLGQPMPGLEDTEQSTSNALSDDYSRRAYSEIAELILLKCNEREAKENDAKVMRPDKGYVSLAQLHTESFSLFCHHPREPYQLPWNLLCRKFFEAFEENYTMEVERLCRYVYEGVPVFIRDAETGEYAVMAENSHLYGFMWIVGERWSGPSVTKKPSWVNGLFMRREDLKIRSWLGDRTDGVPDEEHDELRGLLRYKIGMSQDASNRGPAVPPSFESHSKLLGICAKVLQMHAAQSDNTARAWPLQKQIVPWLQSEFGLSENQAKAVDIVTRPDFAR